MSGEAYQFTSLNVTRPRENVVQVELNRPKKRNAMNIAFWREMRECFRQLSNDSDCRAVVISGAGKIFTAGISKIFHEEGQNTFICSSAVNRTQCRPQAADILISGLYGLDLMAMTSSDLNPDEDEVARKAIQIRQTIEDFQESFTVIEKCRKPVIAAVHSACVGGGIDMISACDVRYCSEDAWFQVKEVDIGLAADVGTLQRFPKVVGNDSAARELVYTARPFYAEEAKSIGFVSRILADREATIEAALDTASLIASKSPVAVQVSKINLVFSRDHSVAEGLTHVATWNQSMLQSGDVMEAATSMMQKKSPKFSKL